MHPVLRALALPLCLCVSTAAGLLWPQYFTTWNGVDLIGINLYLVQIVMFSIGATLSIDDFGNALSMPKAVLVGVLLQFSVMPIVGWAIAAVFGLEAAVAAGLVLVGCCSGGAFSNLMVFLVRGNVALSVTITACSTLLAPMMTPWLMQHLVGRVVEVDFWAMMVLIINLIAVPIGGGLIVNQVSQRRRTVGRFLRRFLPLTAAFGVVAAVLFGYAQLLGGTPLDEAWIDGVLWQGQVLFGVLFLVSFIVNELLAGKPEVFQKFPPIVSIAALCFFLAIVAASSRDELLSAGPVLVVAVALHNVLGMLLGYWLALLAGIRGQNRRTIAFAAGMPNSGMAGGLALSVLKSAEAALAPIVFSTVMNINGLLLASWWRERPPTDERAA